ncbi:MAG: DUF2065 domain-containing protein [Mariprofundaceae bacterium]
MQDLWIALGLVLVLEGAMYALFPQHMIEMMKKIPEIPPSTLRVMGLIGVGAGWLVVWFFRG